jgi:chlorobactene glucosyltransferase
MKKSRLSFARLLLWTHVISIIGFYIVLWFRTNPKRGEGRDQKQPARPQTLATSTPSVSIIVPARNEERNIRRCITSLLEQDYNNFEVIVVDDDSTDGTAHILDEIAREHPHGDRLWVLRLRELPRGWAGKPHALHAGTREAHSDWLLFTDADTWHAPEALRTALAQAINEDVDLFTLYSEQQLTGFWNKVLMPLVFTGINMQYPVKQVNDPNSPVAIANGQYILLRRAVYEQLGGYARPDLRATLLDDRDLAIVVKSNGFRLRLDNSKGLIRTWMYEGLDEIWRGWRKNAFIGSRGGLPFVFLMLLGLPMTAIVPFVLPLLALLRARKGKVARGEFALAGTLELAALLAYRTWLNQHMHVPWYYVFTHPLAAALFEGILAESAWRVLTRKGVDWRGRQYYDTPSTPERDIRSSSVTL